MRVQKEMINFFIIGCCNKAYFSFQAVFQITRTSGCGSTGIPWIFCSISPTQHNKIQLSPLLLPPCDSTSLLRYHYSHNCLTPWSKVLLEKLTVPQLVKNFPTLCGTRSFTTAVTAALNLPPFLSQINQSTSSQQILYYPL